MKVLRTGIAPLVIAAAVGCGEVPEPKLDEYSLSNTVASNGMHIMMSFEGEGELAKVLQKDMDGWCTYAVPPRHFNPRDVGCYGDPIHVLSDQEIQLYTRLAETVREAEFTMDSVRWQQRQARKGE